MEDVDWFNRVSAAAAVITIFSPLLAAVFARIFNRGNENRFEPMLRPLLRPSRRFVISEMERTGRMPIEPTVNHRGRVGVIRRVIIALLWPSVSKPAFVVRTWFKMDGSAWFPEPRGLTVGGYRLMLRVHETESRVQLKESIGTSLRTAARRLYICTPEDYLSPVGAVHCCSIDWRRTRAPRDYPVGCEEVPVELWLALTGGRAISMLWWVGLAIV